MERIRRQEKTLKLMIELYCRNQHKNNPGLCPSCTELLSYALSRLRSCKYMPNKPTCSNCPTPCYKPDQRQRILQAMRYSGPRMLLVHPVLSIQYLWDKWTR